MARREQAAKAGVGNNPDDAANLSSQPVPAANRGRLSSHMAGLAPELCRDNLVKVIPRTIV